MPYIGNPIYQSAFVVDQFSGNGSTTAFTMSVAPAGVTNVLVAVSGVLQDPSTYGVVGNTITFSAAPPSGTGNISCRYLGVPASGVTTTAYRTVTEFTATASQTTFTPPSYTVGFINVYLNGVLLGSADYTATNGTTVVLATGASAGNLLTVESFLVSSVLNAIPNTAGAVSSSNIQTSVALTTPTMTSPTISSGALTIGTTSLGAGNASSFKNRIINGAMTIDQRNAGAAVTSNDTYSLDRWRIYNNTDAVWSVQQDSSAPTGFANSLKVTVTTADGSLGASQNSWIAQPIEGFNTADLSFGTANAKTVTVSFWVRSSLTGTFSGFLLNSAGNRAYVFNYTISSANTWEYKTATVTGDTSGTWIGATNGIGLYVAFNMAAGSNNIGTANTWGSYAQASSGSVQLLSTLNATWFITGVQLEVGSTATSFDYRPYGTELQLCQRYYAKIVSGATYGGIGSGFNGATTQTSTYVKYPVTMRASPTTTQSSLAVSQGSFAVIAITSLSGFFGKDSANINFDVASGLTGGAASTIIGNNNTNAYVDFSAEL